MIKVVRAEELWQQAGAYYVRIQAMAKKHHITLRQEFDEHDSPETKYIVLLDEEFPVATCRFFALDEEHAEIGRVVVLPEYREQGLGRKVIEEAEKWLAELGFRTAVVESRIEAVGFYEKLGYKKDVNRVLFGEVFTCIYMEKEI